MLSVTHPECTPVCSPFADLFRLIGECGRQVPVVHLLLFSSGLNHSDDVDFLQKEPEIRQNLPLLNRKTFELKYSLDKCITNSVSRMTLSKYLLT